MSDRRMATITYRWLPMPDYECRLSAIDAELAKAIGRALRSSDEFTNVMVQVDLGSSAVEF